ncbi:MAG: hypothetical protein COA57_12030 [Flavobacteriales bacterium]|nr:PorP/SprF family type IX secretion system membrane protein [Bacteroidales bacterium AH-315-I05]PCJ83116.1 MAG: hypothetical protein COA57_12030 [Flavobacteriales bacterium]
MKKQAQHTSLLFVLCFLFSVSCFAQDIHFSQFYQTPLIVNPALTGVFGGDQRVILNYKDQWTSFGAPYKTFAFSFDATMLKKKWDNSYLGAGVSVYNDVAGDAKLGTTQVNAALSGILFVSDNNSISAGVMGGFAQRSMKGENFEWGNQFVNGVHDPNQPTGEPAQSLEPFFFGDAAAGINWNYSQEASDIARNNELNLNAGIAAYHINKPKQKYYKLGELEQLYSKLVAHAGAYIGMGNTNIALLPTLFYMRQGPAQEIDFGVMGRFTIQEESKLTGVLKETAVSIGGYYRVGDAIIPAVMFEMANFAVGITYDINVSALTEVSRGRGGMEISLRYVNPNPFKITNRKTNVKFF